MNWLINFIWDYFKCKKCIEYEERQKELHILVLNLLKTQNEILQYINDKSG